MSGICTATFQCRMQAVTAHETSNSYKEEAASLGPTNKFQAFLEERTPKGGSGKSNADASSQPAPLPLLHQSLPAQPTPSSLKGLHGSKGKQQQQRMQTLLQQAAAMGLIRSQNQHSLPSRPLSQSQRVLGGSHTLRGVG